VAASIAAESYAFAGPDRLVHTRVSASAGADLIAVGTA